MTLPNNIVFGSRLVKLEYIEKSEAQKKKIFGEFCPDKNQITLDKSLCDIEMTNTILHEVFHLLHDEYKIDLPAKAEEIVCNSLGSGICHVLYQNPKLLDFIYKSLKR